jgi:hypothetical protein
MQHVSLIDPAAVWSNLKVAGSYPAEGIFFYQDYEASQER